MERKITNEVVERVVADLRERGLVANTGPRPDGTRSPEQWLNAIREDAALVMLHLEASFRDATARSVAVALKEARRLESDIYRFAREVHDIGRDQIDREGPL